MPTTVEGNFKGAGLRVAVVASRFNEFATDALCSGAIEGLTDHGVKDDDITVIRVPGAWEIPLVVRQIAADGKHDCAVAVGAVIRGGTPHFDYVSSGAINGSMQVMMDTGFPVGLGIITTDNVEQAIERSGDKTGNRGFDAAVAVIATTNALRALKNA